MLQTSDDDLSDGDPPDDDCILDIDKDWQAVHFLLTGEFCFAGESKSPAPLCNVVMGGAETKWQSTYGKIRLLSQQEVQDVAAALKEIARESLAIRATPKDFNKHKVYPAYDRWDAAQLGSLLDVYERIKAFFLVAAASRESIFISFD